MRRRGRAGQLSLRSIALGCLALGLLSLLFNITTPWETEGHLQTYSMIRKSITKVLNSGTAWAAIAFYAGGKVTRPWVAVAAGIAAAVGALLVHYLVGSLVGIYPANEIANNVIWFQAALVLCGPIGLAGWLARRTGWLSLIARLVLPMGALAEPFVLGKFTRQWPQRPWPERYSDLASGVALLVIGLISAGYVLWRGPSRGVLPEAGDASSVDHSKSKIGWAS